jgi:hypothetical protein
MRHNKWAFSISGSCRAAGDLHLRRRRERGVVRRLSPAKKFGASAARPMPLKPQPAAYGGMNVGGDGAGIGGGDSGSWR